jgi:myo-inositol-1(or 4)-monophosphatase
MSLKPWDMAAGVLLVRESGGRVTKSDGSDFDVNVADLLASNGGPIHEALAALLQSG